MATFKDNANREWALSIDARSIGDVRDECDPEFMLAVSGKDATFDRLASDPVLLCRVLYVLTRKQRDERGVTEEDFYAALVGDTIDVATSALLKSALRFIPQPRRGLIEAAAARFDKIREMATREAMARLMDPALEERMLTELRRNLDAALQSATTPSTTATGSPDSVASLPSG